MQLNLIDITYTYPGATDPALRNISATFAQGWTGIVGDNGSGKTTLARVAGGALSPDAGTVVPALVAYYCAQDATEAPANLDEFACSYDGTATKLRNILQLADDWSWRYGTLSGGQQKRLQVACALWSQPDVLIMDEPTNHVDHSTRMVIFNALAAFRGIGLLISHDRELLDHLCTQCLFVSNGRVTMRPGGYSQASGQALLERESTIKARNDIRKEKKRIEKEAQRRREEASRTDARRSGRNIDKHDNDARAKKRIYVVSGQDGKAAKLSSNMEGRLSGIDSKLDATRVEKRYEANIWLDIFPSKRNVLVRISEARFALGEDTVLHTPALYIANTDHIALVGDNGCGKTTLVQHIVKLIPGQTRMVYIPQEPTEEQKAAAMTALKELSSDDRGRVLSIVAQLNSIPDRILEGTTISPGEMRKLMLALGILKSPELIIMDEPTNHLDLCSIEALERLLADYPGALLLVSHDIALVQSTTSVVWSITRKENTLELQVR
ncbi:MAG: ABC-F family ATP-binding cassette domain-containing protein [Coriobacteriales bacterium]|nr:ABC-F family ATP-binding cassette domain-containing protein [Coriobacteriales bacterium]